MTNEARLKAELSVVRAVIKAALNKGFLVSVFDSEEWVLKKSNNLKTIIAAMRSTDEDQIIVRDTEGNKKGWMKFIYGNEPYEVINDYSDNDVMGSIYKEAEIVANRIEERC